MVDEGDDGIDCATYTHARRHPMVLGNIGGWTPPFQLSLTQVAVIVVVFVIEFQTRHIWGGWVPRIPGVLLTIALPCVLAWVVRATRIEGRSLPRLALGVLHYLWTPGRGHLGGRAYRPARPSAPFLAAIYVADDGGTR
jgi:hypothetical protein